MKELINNFINSIDTNTYDRIRTSKSNAECRRYLKEHLQKQLMLGGVVGRSEQLKAFAEYLDDLHGGEPFAVNEIDGYLKSL